MLHGTCKNMLNIKKNIEIIIIVFDILIKIRFDILFKKKQNKKKILFQSTKPINLFIQKWIGERREFFEAKEDETY